MIKLVVSDMDGTLIDDSEVLGSKALQVAQILKEKKILFSLATGRVESMTEAYAKQLNIQVPYIVCNGATIVHGRKIMQRYQVPLLGLKDVILTADQLGMSIIYSINGLERVFRFTPWVMEQQRMFDRYHQKHAFSEEEWNTLVVDKISIMDDENNSRIAMIEDMCIKLPAVYGFTRYVDRSVEVVHGEATKASGVRAVAKYLGIDLREIMVIGDHQNDIEMLREAGVGVAVANATPELRSVADYVCQHSHVDGVLEAIGIFC